MMDPLRFLEKNGIGDIAVGKFPLKSKIQAAMATPSSAPLVIRKRPVLHDAASLLARWAEHAKVHPPSPARAVMVKDIRGL